MNKAIIIGALVVMLVLAGCISLPGEQKGKETTTTTGQQGGQQVGQQGEQQNGGTGGLGEQTKEEAQKQINSLEDAVMQNVPLECTAKYTAETTTEVKYWIKNKKIRTETEFNGQKSIAIVKDNKVYIKNPGVMTTPSGVTCDWMVFEQNETGTEAKEYSTTIEDYKNMAKIQVECHPAAFGDEKFETPGKACTMEDLIPKMENLPPEYKECEGLSGQALIDCINKKQ